MSDENKFVLRFRTVLGVVTVVFAVFSIIFGSNPNPTQSSVTVFVLFSSLFVVCAVFFGLFCVGVDAIDEAEMLIDTLIDDMKD